MSLPEPLQQVDRTYVRVNGRRLVYFAGCDYFRLASHPKVLKAAAQALKRCGLNVAASRMTTGNHPLYGELEERLKHFFAAETATLASSGYAPNLMVAQALAGQFSHVLIDERAHGSLKDAAQLFDCKIQTFKHRDPTSLSQVLNRLGNSSPILLTDGMFSHDGGIAPLKEYLRLLPRKGVILLDDAHGAGVLGANGRGTPEHAGVSRRRIIQTITLSKAFGAYGGAVLGSRSLREAIIARSRIFVGNTPLPLPMANAALASLSVLRADRSLRHRLIRNTTQFKERLRAAGFPVPDNDSPILPVALPDQKKSALLKRRLLSAGIHPPFIHYPGGPVAGYFRFVISSEHTPAQLERLAAVLLSFNTK